MLYSNLYFKKKTQVHFLLYVVVFIAFFVSLVLIITKIPKKIVILPTKLTRYEVVNLGAQQAGIFWETAGAETSWIRISDNYETEKSMLYEDLNEKDHKKNGKQHFVFISHLKPNTTYLVSIENEKGIYLDSQNKKYSFKTPPLLSRPVYLNPLYGKVFELNGMPSIGAFVLLYIKDAYPLFTITKDSGEWLIPLSSLVSVKTGKYFDISTEEQVQAIFFNEEKTTVIKSTLHDLSLISQTITLGKTYDSTEEKNVLSASTQQAALQEHIETISILYPRENALIPAQKPLIKGLGIVNADIYAYINSKPQYSFRTKVNNEGIWTILLQDSLQPGNYTLFLNTKDEKANRINLIRHFIIAKNGEQVLGTATAEPTVITPTIRPTVIASATPLPTKSVTTAPRQYSTPIPTLTPFISPTNVPTQVAGVYATAIPTPPTTGQNNMLFIVFSFILLISGSLLLFIF